MKKINMKLIMIGAILDVSGLFACNVVHAAADSDRIEQSLSSFYPAIALASMFSEVDVEQNEAGIQGCINDLLEQADNGNEATVIDQKYTYSDKGTGGFFSSLFNRSKRLPAEVLKMTAFQDENNKVHVAVLRELFDENEITNRSDYFVGGIACAISAATVRERSRGQRETAFAACYENLMHSGMRDIYNFIEELKKTNHIPSTIVGYRMGGTYISNLAAGINLPIDLSLHKKDIKKAYANINIITIDSDICDDVKNNKNQQHVKTNYDTSNSIEIKEYRAPLEQYFYDLVRDEKDERVQAESANIRDEKSNKEREGLGTIAIAMLVGYSVYKTVTYLPTMLSYSTNTLGEIWSWAYSAEAEAKDEDEETL